MKYYRLTMDNGYYLLTNRSKLGGGIEVYDYKIIWNDGAASEWIRDGYFGTEIIKTVSEYEVLALKLKGVI